MKESAKSVLIIAVLAQISRLVMSVQRDTSIFRNLDYVRNAVHTALLAINQAVKNVHINILSMKIQENVELAVYYVMNVLLNLLVMFVYLAISLINMVIASNMISTACSKEKMDVLNALKNTLLKRLQACVENVHLIVLNAHHMIIVCHAIHL